MPNVPPALVQLNNRKNNMEIKTFNLALNVDQLNVIMAALGELPFKTSNELIQAIVKQFNEQVGTTEPPTITDVE
jgi:hypothetical protein